MAKALIGVQRGYSRYADKIAKIQAEVDEYQARLDGEIAQVPDNLRNDAQRIATSNNPYTHSYMLGQVAVIRRNMLPKITELNAVKREAPAPGTPDAVRIEVIDSYDIKDHLKARGYRFERDPQYSLKAAWMIMITDKEQAQAEVAWINEQGIATERH